MKIEEYEKVLERQSISQEAFKSRIEKITPRGRCQLCGWEGEIIVKYECPQCGWKQRNAVTDQK